MKKAIVTGASGFIGSHLVDELLNNDVEVIGVVRHNSDKKEKKHRNFTIVECDLCEISNLFDIITDRNINCIFHTAWQGVSDKDAKDYTIQLNNIEATLKLIDVAQKIGVQTFIGCGSMHEEEVLIEISENKINDNLGIMYKSAKLAAHWMSKVLSKKYGIRFFWPLINNYGEGENSRRLINYIIRSVFSGKVPSLSCADQYYDFVHVGDVAHAMYLIAEYGIDGANYTIGSGNARPLKDFLQIVGKISNEIKGGPTIQLGFGNVTKNVVHLPLNLFNIRNLTKDTGFVPTIPFEEGIKRTANWIYRNEFII